MKYFTLIFYFILLFYSVQAQVVIKGKIINYDGKTKIYYSPTIEGIHTPYWIDIMPSASGNFKIEFENEGFGTTIVGLKGKGIKYHFFHDADSKIYVEFDQGIVESLQKNKRLVTGNTTRGNFIRNEATIVMRSDYEAINKFYNRNIRTSIPTANNLSGTFYSRLLIKEKSPERAVFILDSLKQIEIDQIMKLPFTISLEDEQQEKREKEIKEFLINEVQTFYGSVFLNAMILKRLRQEKQFSKDSTSSLDIYNRKWRILIERFLSETTNLKAIPNSADYLDFLNLYLVVKNSYQLLPGQQIKIKTTDEYTYNRFYNYDTTIIRSQKAVLAYQLDGLQRRMNSEYYYSPTLLNAFYDLQSQYPDSENLKHFEPQVTKLKAYLKSTKTTYNKGVIINRNHKSFESLLGGFKGKNVLIDIWATWCRPCIEDFKYKQMLQPFIDSLQLEVLYISFDKPEWEDRWKNSIKFNELEGHHFRANKKFIEDMWIELGGMVGAIPRYALVDKKGELFLSTASRPSEGTKLVDEINQLLAKE
ncbi:MAG: hypothetical protein OEW67_03205 [Cyclobacteriaceae bacterium]|nr:hypothetical protein [Cyclobacteriaceae bacterium]